MENFAGIIGTYEDSFRANIYTRDPFRMIGLIDVGIRYAFGMERVILAYYSSSGTNSGKIKGLWYPIVGIKEYSGDFREFTAYLNHVLTETTKDGHAEEGWLAKSPFFGGDKKDMGLRGFSCGIHQEKLFGIGKKLRSLYENGRYSLIKEMDAAYINSSVTIDKRLYHNLRTQRVNYEEFIRDIYEEI
ncbi:MAG TPA: hypothetical protein GXX75_00755 [Clostridiales bacterium]|nr:hypothetical protein [Clostridiales bacterium]